MQRTVPLILQLEKRNQSGILVRSILPLPESDSAVVSVGVLGHLVIKVLNTMLNIPKNESFTRDYSSMTSLKGLRVASWSRFS